MTSSFFLVRKQFWLVRPYSAGFLFVTGRLSLCNTAPVTWIEFQGRQLWATCVRGVYCCGTKPVATRRIAQDGAWRPPPVSRLSDWVYYVAPFFPSARIL